ncbi:MAG TPA: tail fiber domain-containing protein [Verrucomicrobiae bacterium]|nr:tail fiber domain-containing protein [Verrucomicrobiae bacterium]
MKRRNALIGLAALFLLVSWLRAQQAAVVGASSAVVPRLVNFSGKAVAADGRGYFGVAGVTFAIYSVQTGGSPLWLETQNVNVDAKGNYTAQLGATQTEGLPLELFTSGEARWLGVRVNGGEEQARVLLLSVPYALKAADAETVGGLPASAFMLAAPATAAVNSATPAESAGTLSPSLSGTGTTDYLPLWTSASTLGSSVLFQSGSGSSAKIGIGNTTPAATLDVTGGATVRGLLNLPAASNATAAAGANSRPLGLVASAFNSNSKAAVNQVFHWQAEPVANNTPSPSATLNLLFAVAPAAAAETGLRINNKGQITFAGGQSFPGTITKVAAGTDLTGGGTSGVVTLNLDTTRVPQLNAVNTFTGNQTVNGNLNATGAVTGSSFQIGSNLFAFGDYSNANAFLGFGGSTAGMGTNNTATGVSSLVAFTTGSWNTASGYLALSADTVGSFNTADGAFSLSVNNTGYSNVGVGIYALAANTVGAQNTSVGTESLYTNTTGSYNTAVGQDSLSTNTTGNLLTCVGFNCAVASDSLSNATAIGAHARVGASNSLILGGTGQYAVKVGIGTETPTAILTIAQGAGHPVSDSWETYSSRRWKTNIHTLHNALGKVERLRGVTYDMKDSGKHEVGVIAEEVGGIVPELVTYEANGKDARSVDYSRLTALLIEATKEQQQQIRQQNAMLRAQAAAIRSLRSELRETRQSVQSIKAQIGAPQATFIAQK